MSNQKLNKAGERYTEKKILKKIGPIVDLASLVGGVIDKTIPLCEFLSVASAAEYGGKVWGHTLQERQSGSLGTEEQREVMYITTCVAAAYEVFQVCLKTKKNDVLHIHINDFISLCEQPFEKYGPTEYAGAPEPKYKKCLCAFYSKIKDRLQSELKRRCDKSDVETEENMATLRWHVNFSTQAYEHHQRLLAESCQESEEFKQWLGRKRKSYREVKRKIVGGVYLRELDPGKYLEQTIEFEEKKILGARPEGMGANAPRGCKAASAKQTWLMSLAERLKQSAIFLLGEGGMGKTTFLSYLYNEGFDETEYSDVGNPFSGVILISLSSVISQNIKPNPDKPFTDVEKSFIFRRIAAAEGDESRKQCQKWHDIMREEREKPFLLLLDGLNEMREKKALSGDAYAQIITEITSLTKTMYSGVRIIITSRVETTSERLDQISDLQSANTSVARLNGIQDEFPHADELKLEPEMRALLKRPMYHSYFIKKLGVKDYAFPKTRYEALREMFSAFTEQSNDNALLTEERNRRNCVLKYFLPVVANCMTRQGGYTLYGMDAYLQEMDTTCTQELIARDAVYGAIFSKNAISKLIQEFEDRVLPYLLTGEQVLVKNEEGYKFSHQDYRDLLAAEYYLQRLEWLKKSSSPRVRWDECWNEDIPGMDIHAYDSAALSLVYEALQFGKKGKFKSYFDSENKVLKLSDVVPGYLTWIYAACQLQDFSNMYKIDVTDEARPIFEPLAEYVIDYDIKSALAGMAKRLTEKAIRIIIKAAELYRRIKDYDKAMKVAKSALPLVADDPRGIIEVNHAIAKIWLYHFQDKREAEVGHDELLGALKDLRICATGQTDVVSPNVFSCALVSMLLTSPQAYLEKNAAYKEFREGLATCDEDTAVAAFWVLYRGVFQKGRLSDNLSLLVYSVKQMILMLGENKVQIISDDITAIDIAALDMLRSGKVKIVKPNNADPVPSKENCYVIRELLTKITSFNPPLKHYWNGLTRYIIEEDKHSAKAELSQDSDTRAKLWFAFLNNDLSALDNVLAERRIQLKHLSDAGHGKKVEDDDVKQKRLVTQYETCYRIDSYNQFQYFGRDIFALYEHLKKQMKGA